jgi:hypothetical protein
VSGRPHASLGPGIPDPLPELNELVSDGCRVPEHVRVVATPVLGGLHHEYRLARRRGTGRNAVRVNLRITRPL